MECKTIICPIDGSELMDKAEDAAAYISKISGAKLILLYVATKWYSASDVVRDSKEWRAIREGWLNEGNTLLAKEKKKLVDMGVKDIEAVIRDGEASFEIVSLAEERKADMIVMATRHYSSVGKLFTGSITDKVSRRAVCPVLWVFAK